MSGEKLEDADVFRRRCAAERAAWDRLVAGRRAYDSGLGWAPDVGQLEKLTMEWITAAQRLSRA